MKNMTHTQAMYYLCDHPGDEPMVAYAVQQRPKGGDDPWRVMGLKWDNLEQACDHANRLEESAERDEIEQRIVKITYEVALNV